MPAERSWSGDVLAGASGRDGALRRRVVVAAARSVDASRLTGEPMPVAAASRRRAPAAAASTSRARSTLRVDGAGRREPVRADRGAGPHRAGQQVSAPAAGRSLRRLVHPAHAASCAAAPGSCPGDPVRVLAVLVVATPCPLILATPVAIIGGINRAARRGIIFRHGGALEQLGRVSVAVFDKTGTLTVGHPEVARVCPRAIVHRGRDAAPGRGCRAGLGPPAGAARWSRRRGREGVALRGEELVEAPGQGVARDRWTGDEVTVGGGRI